MQVYAAEEKSINALENLTNIKDQIESIRGNGKKIGVEDASKLAGPEKRTAVALKNIITVKDALFPAGTKGHFQMCVKVSTEGTTKCCIVFLNQ